MNTKPAIEQYSDELENELHKALDVINKVRDMFFSATLTDDGGYIVDASKFHEIANEIVTVIPE